MYIGVESKRCADNWWTSFLYINNYVNTQGMCMFTTWYLSCDFQMFIIGVLAIAVVGRRVKVGYFILGCLAIISFVVPFAVTYIQQTDAILRILPSTSDVRVNEFFQTQYIRTHMRFIAYVLGLAAGILMYRVRDTKYRLSVASTWIIVILTFVIINICQLMGYIFFIPGRKYNPLEAASYNILHRVVYTTCIIVLIFTGGSSKFKVFQRMLASRVMVFLSKLTFGVYLVHSMFILYDIGVQRAPKYHSVHTQVQTLFADVFLSYLLAFIMYLTVEMPTKNILRLLLINGKTSE